MDNKPPDWLNEKMPPWLTFAIVFGVVFLVTLVIIRVTQVDLNTLLPGVFMAVIALYVIKMLRTPGAVVNPLAQWYNQRGALQFNRGNLDPALELFTKAIRQSPRFGWAYSNRGAAHFRKNDLEKALADLNEAIRLAPKLAEAYVNRGAVYAGMGDIEQALKEWSEALQYSPKYGLAYNDRGYAYSRIGELEKALADCDKAVALSRRRVYAPYAYGSRGHTHFLLGEYEKALADFEQSEKRKPDHKFAIAGKAIAHHALGHLERAKFYWQALIEMDESYRDPNALQAEYHCADAFVEEARKVVATLSDGA